MNTPAQQDRFYEDLPVVDGFGSLMDPALYAPLPGDWTIGLADIVQSTKAIAENKYKSVNMAGAAVIAAVTNALAEREFPFVFGGDGASFAVSAPDVQRARKALAATSTWVKSDLGLTMRVALIPIADIRARGLDVRVARFAPSPNVSYAMFSGGGLGWAEAAMKRGEFAVLPSPPDVLPDLSGLSCRFEEIPSANGLILSVIAMPAPGGDAVAFRKLTEGIIALVEKTPNAGRPVPPGGPPIGWPPAGVDLEARALRGGSLFRRRASVLAQTLFSYLIMRFGIRVGEFVPKTYVEQVVANSDFRKYDDGLRMILDCTPGLADELQARLAQAAADGVARYGVHRQDAAMMTCFTPSVFRADHVHFIDGARGGYATAAIALKAAAA
jgi:DUF3095 family protein